MPRDGATIFADLIGKLDVPHVACAKCNRDGRYALRRLLDTQPLPMHILRMATR